MSQETIKVKEKDIVILRFPSEWPVEEKDLVGMMKTIRDVINKDSTIANRFICLAKGADIETMSEEDFISLWKNNFGEQSFEEAANEVELDEIENDLIQRHLAEHNINQENFDDSKIVGSDYPFNTEFGSGKTMEEMEQIDDDNLDNFKNPNQFDLFQDEETLDE